MASPTGGGVSQVRIYKQRRKSLHIRVLESLVQSSSPAHFQMTVQAEVGWAKTSRFKYTQTRFERPFGKYLSFTRIDGLSSYATYYHENENISLDEQF